MVLYTTESPDTILPRYLDAMIYQYIPVIPEKPSQTLEPNLVQRFRRWWTATLVVSATQGLRNKRARILAPPACPSAHLLWGSQPLLEAVSLNKRRAKQVAYVLHCGLLFIVTNGVVDAAGYSVAAAQGRRGRRRTLPGPCDASQT
jgi:hypothetical protein